VRRALPFITSAAAVLFLAIPAAANGRFPASNQLVFSPTDPNLLVLRTSYGVLPSHDNGTTWGYICESALGLPSIGGEDPSIGLTENSSLVLGVAVGLNVSADVGCNWNCIGGPLAGQVITDIAVRPDNPAGAVTLTSTLLPSDSSQSGTDNQVFETTDNGATWTGIGMPIPEFVVVTTIDVAKTDPNIVYVSGMRGYGTSRTASLFVSTNKGQMWTEHVLPAGEYDPTMEDEVFIGAVDPSNADRVYMRSSALMTGGKSRLTVVNGASTASPTFANVDVFDVGMAKTGEITGELLGFALSPDGSKVYVGTEESGLFVASTSDFKFTNKSSKVVQCLATRGSELWMCSAEVSGFVLGVSTDDGATFTAKLPTLGDLTGAIACTANPKGAACNTTQNSSTCPADFMTFCMTYGCGAPEGGTGDNEGAPPKSSSSCSCSLVGLVGGGGGAMLAGAVAVLGVAIRRRRRSR
jgi:Sortilin, neurotensin receptor 3,